jgi:hypothetical protein
MLHVKTDTYANTLFKQSNVIKSLNQFCHRILSFQCSNYPAV